MEAYKKQIGDIFPRNKLLEIPFYQRSYVWGPEEWERLLEDLKGMCERDEEYFLGSVILKNTTISGPNDENFAGKFVVVDGQQRLTSLLILAKVIALRGDDTDTFDNFFITKNKKKGFCAPSLRHNYMDRPDFERVLALDELKDLGGESRVIQAYNYFRENIDDQLADLMNLDTLTALMSFVMITVNDNEDEQQIFDTINSLGVRLTTAELLKNYFFSSQDLESYKNHWKEIFEKDEDTREYWDQEIVAGRLKRTLIDIFFDSVLQIITLDKKLNVRDEDRKSYEKVEKLFHSYRDFIEIKQYRSKQEVIDLIKPLAKSFRDVFSPSACSSGVGNTPSVERINVIIFGLKNSTLIPYVLFLRNRIPANSPDFEIMLGILESYVMRRMVCRETTKNYNRFFSTLIRDEIATPDTLRNHLKTKVDVTASLPDDVELEESFKKESKLTSLQARGILYLLETAAWDDASSTAMLGFDAYSLEHLMPKKWRNHWGRLGTPDLEQARDVKLLTLGNLAIIPQKLNRSISDSCWTDKKTGKNKKPGLTLCAGGLPSMVAPLSLDTWDEQAVSDRASVLFDYAKTAWSI